MTNVIHFPGRHPLPLVPPSTLDALAELTAVELELGRARVAQIRSETRQANALWVAYCCRKVLFWGIVLWLFSAMFGGAKAEPRSQTFYDKQGSFAGSSFRSGNQTSYSDGQNRYIGSATTQGRTTRHYDATGSFIGSTTDRKPR